MHAVVAVNPFRCRLWQLHDRLDDHIDESTCKAEIESFIEHGQLIPVLGRRTPGGDDCDVELIYGARRLFVARHLNKSLLVDLHDDISDRDAAVALDIENRQRRDVSPYERGLSYARLLRAGHFKSQEDICRTMKVSRAQVSRLLKISRLPSVVVGAFESGLDICEQWGLDLVDAVEDPNRRKHVIQAARSLAAAATRPPPSEIYRQLFLASGSGRRPRLGSSDKVVKARNGAPLFRVRHQRTSVALIFPLDLVSKGALEAIQSSLAELLEGQRHTSVERRPIRPEFELRAS